jgi:hypothetical protein
MFRVFRVFDSLTKSLNSILELFTRYNKRVNSNSKNNRAEFRNGEKSKLYSRVLNPSFEGSA